MLTLPSRPPTSGWNQRHYGKHLLAGARGRGSAAEICVCVCVLPRFEDKRNFCFLTGKTIPCIFLVMLGCENAFLLQQRVFKK